MELRGFEPLTPSMRTERSGRQGPCSTTSPQFRGIDAATITASDRVSRHFAAPNLLPKIECRLEARRGLDVHSRRVAPQPMKLGPRPLRPGPRRLLGRVQQISIDGFTLAGLQAAWRPPGCAASGVTRPCNGLPRQFAAAVQKRDGRTPKTWVTVGPGPELRCSPGWEPRAARRSR